MWEFAALIINDENNELVAGTDRNKNLNPVNVNVVSLGDCRALLEIWTEGHSSLVVIALCAILIPTETCLRHCTNMSTQAVKKGASQTVVGLIFGCYAVCNLFGSLIMGRYVSTCHHFSSHWFFFSATWCWVTDTLILCRLRSSKLVQSLCWLQDFWCRRAAPSCLGKCRHLLWNQQLAVDPVLIH